MEHFSIIDTETGETVVDTSWPQIHVASLDEAMMVGEDQHAYDNGKLDAADFIAHWGIHPDADYLVSYTFDKE
jgi:hypothetical protein